LALMTAEQRQRLTHFVEQVEMAADWSGFTR
jgi:hypothetical protein